MFYEDFRIGQSVSLGEATFSREAILAYGRLFDPRIAAAAARGDAPLAASGLHVAAAGMRRLVDERHLHGIEAALYVPYLAHLALVLFFAEQSNLAKPFDPLLRRLGPGAGGDFIAVVVDVLEVLVTIDDPEAYTAPFTVAVRQKIMPNTELIEFVCAENDKFGSYLDNAQKVGAPK